MMNNAKFAQKPTDLLHGKVPTAYVTEPITNRLIRNESAMVKYYHKSITRLNEWLKM